MAIDRTFDFGRATHITQGDIAEIFNRSSEDLEEKNMPSTIYHALADLLNGDLDHVELRRAIEKTLKTTTV